MILWGSSPGPKKGFRIQDFEFSPSFVIHFCLLRSISGTMFLKLILLLTLVLRFWYWLRYILTSASTWIHRHFWPALSPKKDHSNCPPLSDWKNYFSIQAWTSGRLCWVHPALLLSSGSRPLTSVWTSAHSVHSSHNLVGLEDCRSEERKFGSGSGKIIRIRYIGFKC